MDAGAVALQRVLDPEAHASGDVAGAWRWMRRHAPVHHHPPSAFPSFWSVTRYDDVRAVYRDHETFSSSNGVLLRPTVLGPDPGASLTLALTDPPRHRLLRGLMTKWFTERSARALEGSIRATVRRLLADAVDREACDFTHDIAGRLTLSVTCEILGVPAEDHAAVFAWVSEAFERSSPLATHRQFAPYVIDLMDERAGAATDDLLSALIHESVDGERLTEEEVFLNCENLVGATENAGLSLSAALVAFLDHPDQWRRLRDEPALLAAAVEESLRWASSATHSMRTVTRPTDLGGQRLAAGDRVVVWLPSANRDEFAFIDANRFDVGRAPNRHVALAAGEHLCIGVPLARAHLRALLTELLDTVETIVPTGPFTPVRSIVVNGPAHLPVRLLPR